MESWKRYGSRLWAVKWIFLFIAPPLLVLFLFPALIEPMLWLLICIAAAIVLSIVLRRRIRTRFRLTAVRYVLLTLGVIVLIILLFANDQRRPSRVDVSPLAELSAEQVGRIEDVIMQLEGTVAVRGFSVSEHPTRRFYSFGWFVPDWHREALQISVSVYTDEQRAIEVTQNLRNASRGRLYTYIDNDNNTEAMLAHSSMPRHHGLAIPTSNRRLQSTIRIGNTRIRLNETLPWYHLRDSNSSRFIALLAEMLQNEDFDWDAWARPEPPADGRYRLHELSLYVPTGMTAFHPDRDPEGMLIITLTAAENRSAQSRRPHRHLFVSWQETNRRSSNLEPGGIYDFPIRDTTFTVLREGTMLIGGMPAVYMEVSSFRSNSLIVASRGMIVRVVSGQYQYDFRFRVGLLDDYTALLPAVMEIIESAKFYTQ